MNIYNLLSQEITYQAEQTKGKNVEDLNKINEFALTDIYRTPHSKFQRSEIHSLCSLTSLELHHNSVIDIARKPSKYLEIEQ